MSLGEMLNKNPAVGVVIAVVAIGVAGFVIMRTSGGGTHKPIESRYFYDLTSGELIAMDSEPAPVTTPSGSQAVWAHVFSCGSCDDASQRFVTYLQKMTDEAKQESAKPLSQQDSDIIMNGNRVAFPPEEPGGEIAWVSADDPRMMRVSELPMDKCASSGGTPKTCMP